MQVHADAWNDRLDEHGVTGREGDIDREEPGRSDTVPVRGNLFPAALLPAR